MTSETRLQQRIRRDFLDPGSAAGIQHLLDKLTADSTDRMLSTERVHAAIILLAAGSPSRCREALELAKLDWRDLLVNAGLANADWPIRLDQELGPEHTGSATEASETPH